MNRANIKPPFLDRAEHGIEWDDEEDAEMSRMCRDRNPLTPKQIAESNATMKLILARLGCPLDDSQEPRPDAVVL